MSGEEFIVAIVAIIAGVSFAGYFIGKITGLIKAWINKGSSDGYNDEDFERLAKAFMQHKQIMEKRVENLEAIVTEEQSEAIEEKISYPELEEPDDEGMLSNDLENKKNKQRN